MLRPARNVESHIVNGPLGACGVQGAAPAALFPLSMNQFVSNSAVEHGRGPDLRRAALAALCEREPAAKAAAAGALFARYRAGETICRFDEPLDEPPGLPGRPERPTLVEPRLLRHRGMQTQAGRAVLLHALAHIEFNAINLALDAVWRFAGLPPAYYADWLRVAAEEAHHFEMLQSRLHEFGHAYGDFPAHDGLWDMCARTREDVLARMALVPRTLEARGLDASPPIRARLVQAGDAQSAAILDVILRDEIGHVRIGNRWFRHVCEARGLEPHETYTRLAAQYGAPRLRGPFNFDARRDAGFDDAELAALASQERTDRGPDAP